MEVQLREHLAAVDEQQEWLALRSFLELDEIGDAFTIDPAPEPVDGLGGIREDLSLLEVQERGLQRGRDLLCGPERIRQRRFHRAAKSASMRSKSFSVVTFIMRGFPGTIDTVAPIRSHSAASSVAVARA